MQEDRSIHLPMPTLLWMAKAFWALHREMEADIEDQCGDAFERDLHD